MGAPSAALLLTAGLVWRVTGLRPAGRAVVRGATRPDDDDRAVAGILLVRAGDRAVPLVADALERLPAGADPGVLVDVLGSLGTTAARTALTAATGSPRPDVAAAARTALDGLDGSSPPAA